MRGGRDRHRVRVRRHAAYLRQQEGRHIGIAGDRELHHHSGPPRSAGEQPRAFRHLFRRRPRAGGAQPPAKAGNLPRRRHHAAAAREVEAALPTRSLRDCARRNTAPSADHPRPAACCRLRPECPSRAPPGPARRATDRRSGSARRRSQAAGLRGLPSRSTGATLGEFHRHRVAVHPVQAAPRFIAQRVAAILGRWRATAARCRAQHGWRCAAPPPAENGQSRRRGLPPSHSAAPRPGSRPSPPPDQAPGRGRYRASACTRLSGV